MSMSKKDYIALAAAIKASHLSQLPTDSNAEFAVHLSTLLCVAETIASECAANNPKFDRQRFLAACGVQS